MNLPTIAFAPIVFANIFAGYWPYWRADTTRILDGSYLERKSAASLIRSSVDWMSRTYNPSVRTRYTNLIMLCVFCCVPIWIPAARYSSIGTSDVDSFTSALTSEFSTLSSTFSSTTSSVISINSPQLYVISFDRNRNYTLVQFFHCKVQ